MRIQIEKFLAVTAMLASTAVIAGGCSSEDTKTNNTGSGGTGAKGGTGGKDASTGGTDAATGGAAGTSTGGAAGGGGVAGGGGTAGSGGTCLGDGDPDAGTEGIDCLGLPYYATMCGADLDAGVEGTANLGAQFCDYMSAYGRGEVAADVYSCLAVISGDACAQAAEDAVQKCYTDAAQNACQQPPFPDGDGGTIDACADLNSDCPAVSVATCNLALNPLTSTYVETVLQCYLGKSGDCQTDFEDCVNLP